MEKSKNIFKGRGTLLMSLASMGLLASFALSAVAADEPAKKIETAKKEEPIKQSGSFFIKFKISASDTKIQEVSDYYGANKILPLSSAESSDRKDPEQWRKLKFDAVDDVKDIARRIVLDTRVDEIDGVVAQVNK